MIPVLATVVRMAPAVSLAGKLAQNMTTKSETPDEECYEDENGEVKPCKKCAEKARISTTSENKYIGMQEKVSIINFLKAINEKNYAAAHKYLKNIMETKLTKKISSCKNVRLF